MPRHCALLIAGLFCWMALGLVPGNGAATGASTMIVGSPVNGLAYIQRFDGIVQMHTVSGALQPLQVVIRDWHVFNNHREPVQILAHAFTVAHLVSGTVTTVIGGQRVERGPNGYWSLPPGTSMTITVRGEAAIIETVPSGPVPAGT